MKVPLFPLVFCYVLLDKATAQHYAHPPDYGYMCGSAAPCSYVTGPSMGSGGMMPVQQQQPCLSQYPVRCVPMIQQYGAVGCICSPYQQPGMGYPGAGGMERPPFPIYYPGHDLPDYSVGRPPLRRPVCRIECRQEDDDYWDLYPTYDDQWDWLPDRSAYRRPRCRRVCRRRPEWIGGNHYPGAPDTDYPLGWDDDEDQGYWWDETGNDGDENDGEEDDDDDDSKGNNEDQGGGGNNPGNTNPGTKPPRPAQCKPGKQPKPGRPPQWSRPGRPGRPNPYPRPPGGEWPGVNRPGGGYPWGPSRGKCKKKCCAGTVCPRGPAGPAGPVGRAGVKGPRGDNGKDGRAGPKGDQGEKGEAGETGPAGAPGSKGEPGAQGERGPRGETGPKGDIGARGDIGPKGDTGADGGRGEKGETGAKGDPGERGQRGDRGEAGLKGETGPKGDPGEEGHRGDKGDKGDTGEKGDKGDVGQKGDKGDTGEKGDKGDKGDRGDRGDKGESGLSGSANPSISPGPNPPTDGEKPSDQDSGSLTSLEKLNLCKDPKAAPRDVKVGDLVFTVTCGEAMEQNRETINTRNIAEAMIICAAWPECHQVSTLPDGHIEGSRSKRLNEELYKVKGGANAKLKATRPSANVSPEVEALYGRDCPRIEGYSVTFGSKTFKVTCTNGTPDFKELYRTGTGDEPVDCIALCASEPTCQAITQVKKDGVRKCVMASEKISDLHSGGPGSGTWVAQKVD